MLNKPIDVLCYSIFLVINSAFNKSRPMYVYCINYTQAQLSEQHETMRIYETK